MADPLRIFYTWPGSYNRPANPSATSGQIFYRDALRHSAYLIAKHELRVWFEPNWKDARLLARRFPHCMICSIPEESDTSSLHKVPAWRRRPQRGVV
jgi:hypothetical protein